MKIRLLQASFLMALLFLATGGYAFPVINNLSVQEPNLWLGETETIFLNCTDDNSTELMTPYADITTSSAIFPNTVFTLDSNGMHYLAISTAQPSNFYKTGTFNATVYCKNALEETVNETVSFAVSNLSMEVNKVTSPVYLGDVEEANIFVKKDGNTITSNINFSITLDETKMTLLSQPYYDFAKGWILRFSTAGQAAGTRTLSISANYGRASVSSAREIKVANVVEFSFLGIGKTWISANDALSVQLKAIERGNPVQIKKEQLTVQMDSTNVNIIEITPPAAGVSTVKFSAPSMSAGEHTLKIVFNYNNFSESYSKGVSYVIPASGNIFISTEKSSQVQMKFTTSGAELPVKVESSGAYSALIPPAKYTIFLSDGAPTLEIINADIITFDDGIKYQPLVSGTVMGIQGAGIYYYGAVFGYSEARLKLPYDQSKVNDESELRAYICENWNSGKKTCMADWKVIDSKIDTVRKIATIDNAILNAAYIIGSPDSAGIEANTEKEIYGLNEKIKVTGISLDGAKNMLGDASITVSVNGLAIAVSTESNAQGIFSVELQNPGAEGTYSATVSISKPPYISSQKQINFTVVKTADLTIAGPDTIRTNPGEQSDIQFRLINVGEADLNDLKISIKGLPSNYYRIVPSDTIEQINSGAEKSVSVHFGIPDDAARATFGASIEASKGDFIRTQNFALTVLSAANASSSVIITQTQAPANENAQNSNSTTYFSLSMPTAFSTFFAAQSDFSYIAAFAVASFSAAIALRRRRLTSKKYSVSGGKSSNRNMIFEIKNKIAESKKTRNKKMTGRRFSKYVKNW